MLRGFNLTIAAGVLFAIIAAAGAGAWWGDRNGAARVQAKWDTAKLEQKERLADARTRAEQHDVALTAARTRQDRDAAAALAKYREEISRENACSTGAPIGAAGVERLRDIAGER